MFLQLFIISLVLVGIALLALGIRMLIRRGSKFPDTHISHNKEMRNRGIHCYQTQEKVERLKIIPQIDGLDSDMGCGCGCTCTDKPCP